MQVRGGEGILDRVLGLMSVTQQRIRAHEQFAAVLAHDTLQFFVLQLHAPPFFKASL